MILVGTGGNALDCGHPSQAPLAAPRCHAVAEAQHAPPPDPFPIPGNQAERVLLITQCEEKG